MRGTAPVRPKRGEAKRLYVRPQFRGRGVGRALLHWVIAEARAMGYRELVGDTMPEMGGRSPCTTAPASNAPDPMRIAYSGSDLLAPESL